MGEVNKNIESTSKTFTGLLVLGLVGLLFLIVFGNLSGNLGFSDVSNITVNESGHDINITASTLGLAGVENFVSLAVTQVINGTDGQIVLSGNYTVDSTAGTIIGAPGRTSNWSLVNITYTSSFTSQGELSTTGVINNLSGGAETFFTFSNVWFTLLAVVLLIIIVMGVIGVVRKNGKTDFSS